MKTKSKTTKLILLWLSAILLLTVIAACADMNELPADGEPPFTTFYDIPGLTQEDIQAIEDLLTDHTSFNYAMMLSTETFIDGRGEMSGFSRLFTDYLSELFGIEFFIEIMGFEDVMRGLEDGSVDFTGTLTPTAERREIYHMTEPIAQRSIRCFRLIGSEPIEDITQERIPRYALLEGAASTADILAHSFYEFEPVFISEYIKAYDMLVSSEIDALLAESSAETVFDEMGNIIAEPFVPMINAFVSFTAYRDELAPIVKAVQRLLENGGAYYISTLYEQGYYRYLHYKISLQLTPSEHEYIKSNPDIRFGAEFDNYPISFFDEHIGEWQGIALDVMDEISLLTDLEYTVDNHIDATWDELIEMLESGEIHMISELIWSPEREGRFLWPDMHYMTDRSVLIARTGYHHVDINRLYTENVGLTTDTAHTEFFNTWFPNHPQVTYFDDHLSALDALREGTVDLVMTSYSTSLYLSNYLEETAFIPSIIFNDNFESTFGINKERQLLASIINKAFVYIDIDGITENWLHKTYDYRMNLAEQNNNLFRNMILVMLCVLLLVGALLVRNRHTKKRLEVLVDSRTKELAGSVKEISKARDEAEAANESKSYFLANMSHELRTPMNAISGITEIILLNDNLTPDVKDGLIKINHSCNLLMGILNDILDFSKIEAGKMDIIRKEYTVADMIDDSVQLNMMRIGSKRIRFVLDVDENIPAKLLGDELRIKQIMNNLLSNAFKYTYDGEVRLSFSIAQFETGMIAPNPNTILLQIRVEDTGCGMSVKQLSKLFEEYTRFYQPDGKKSVEGTGLGLSITRRLISLMNGNINVESRVGEGTVFTVTLPQDKIGSEVLGKEITDNLKSLKMNYSRGEKGNSIVREPMPYGHILVVDDVETNLFVAMGLMKPYKLNIDTVMSGREAIDRVRNKTYDIIFMDHMMPDLDGIETTMHLRNSGYDAPIVALTANAVSGQSEMFIENGFDDFIAKPIDIRQLNAVLNHFIRDKQSPEVIEKARLESVARDDANGKNGNNTKNGQVSGGNVGTGDDGTEIGSKTGSLTGRKIDGLDIAAGVEKYNDDEDIYIKILTSYATSARGILDAITEMKTVGKENIDDYRLRVHSMKGTSLDICAEHVGKTAAELEKAAKAGDFDYINENTREFLMNAYSVIDELDKLLYELHNLNPKDTKDTPDPELLIKLRDACDIYSMDGVDNAMDEMEKYKYDNDDGLVAWLREQVNIMGFTQIVERLKDI